VPDVEPASVPVELTNLRSVRVLPELLAGFLALLGIAAVAHVLVTSARRRRHDFAVLRAIGLTRGGTRLVLNWQGTAVATVGLLLGVPLGVVLGRVGWRLVTERVPLLNVPPFAGEPVLVLIAATVVVVNLLALWPGRIVARRRMPAEELRAE
jgi:ABC-type lipoprotein release transport system permease subunit